MIYEGDFVKFGKECGIVLSIYTNGKRMKVATVTKNRNIAIDSAALYRGRIKDEDLLTKLYDRFWHLDD